MWVRQGEGVVEPQYSNPLQPYANTFIASGIALTTVVLGKSVWPSLFGVWRAAVQTLAKCCFWSTTPCQGQLLDKAPWRFWRFYGLLMALLKLVGVVLRDSLMSSTLPMCSVQRPFIVSFAHIHAVENASRTLLLGCCASARAPVPHLCWQASRGPSLHRTIDAHFWHVPGRGN